jgi:uncharacterized membrane protein
MTITEGTPPSRSPLVQLSEAIEATTAFDGVAAWLRPLADTLLRSPQSRAVLEGDWLGHAVHPLLTDLPIGFWTSANVLDLVGGESARPAAELLTGLGVASALPTALTGLAEWGGLTSERERRTGTAHAVGNVAALSCFAASWVARRRGRWATGAALGLAGASFATVAGFLGGHLTIARKVGSRHPAFDD